MADNINLVPQEEQKQQEKVQTVKKSTYLAIALFVLVAGVTGFFYYQNLQTNQNIAKHNASIELLRGQIEKQAEIEILARNLGTKYNTLQGILNSRNYFSLFMQEIKARVPDSVQIDTFSIGKQNTVNISGTGTDYISIARFIRNVSNDSFTGAAEGFENLFTDVTLNSVNLDAQTSEARFFIVVTYDEGLLKQ